MASGEKDTSLKGPDKGEAYGMAAITQVLAGLRFPVSKQELLNHVADRQVRYYKNGDLIGLKRVIEQAKMDEFQKPTDVVHAVKDAVEKVLKAA